MGSIVCLGGAVIDRSYHAFAPIVAATSNPCQPQGGFGGVARNVAETLARLGRQVSLMTALGEDEGGRSIRSHMESLGVSMDRTLACPDQPTAEYVALIDASRELYVAMAAMDIFEQLTPEHLETIWPDLAAHAWVFADCNSPAASLDRLARLSAQAGTLLAIDTVSVPKAKRLPHDLSAFDVMFTNRDEANALLGAPAASPADAARQIMARGARSVVLTMEADGHVVASADGLFTMPGLACVPVDITGAGDALIAGTLDGLMGGAPLQEATRQGALLATLTLETNPGSRHEVSQKWLAGHAHRLDGVITQRLS